jgi:hypothetical protein
MDSVSFAELDLWSREVFVVTFRVREPELPAVQLWGWTESYKFRYKPEEVL